MDKEWKQEFNKVILHLQKSREYGQMAYSYPIFCRKIKKPRLMQVTGWKYIYNLLKPKVYFSESNYSLQVQYDYIKNHIDYMNQQDLPHENYICEMIFSNYYGKIAYIKWFTRLTIGNHGVSGYFTTYCNYTPKYIIIKHKIVSANSLSEKYNTSIRLCLDKIYEKRKKELYESFILEMAYKIRIMKRIRLNQHNINSILSYLI
jgi:hypothetical protein